MPAGPVNYRMAEDLRRARRINGGKSKQHDPFDDLRAAIVLQAIQDWNDGFEHITKRYNASSLQELIKRYPKQSDWEKVCTKHVLRMIDAEHFFRSEYCEDLCGIGGALILKKLREQGKTNLRKAYVNSSKTTKTA